MARKDILAVIEGLEARKSCIPEPPCQIGDVLWTVNGNGDRVVVERMICRNLMWNGESWEALEGDMFGGEVDEKSICTSIELAYREAQRRLEENNEK